MTIEKLHDMVKRGAAAITDGLASAGERMPGLSQVTLSAGGITVTATPAPAPSGGPSKCCPTCGKVV